MKTVVWEVDMSEVNREIARLRATPYKAIIALEHTLHETLIATQADVHVITGSLKGSGTSESNYHDDVWTGHIEYGGRAPGFINNPVDYAFYEWRRGGTHDFFAAAEGFHGAFIDAIETHFDPGA